MNMLYYAYNSCKMDESLYGREGKFYVKQKLYLDNVNKKVTQAVQRL
jgi:hypothetical protein